ncbi:MAG: cell wall metabolism sensor histidine kinase WalK [Clostridia bacterium]|nr:cell wall metabolism sensor histidine kinase WalK [Clostridia bacterium]
MRSIQSKLVIIYLAVVLIVMILSGVFIVDGLSNYEYGKVEEDLIITANQLSDVIDTDESSNEMKETIGKIVSITESKKKHIYILDKKGEIYAYLGESRDNINSSVVIAAMNGRSQVARNVSSATIEYAVPFEEYYIYIKTSTSDVNEKIMEAKRIIIFAIAIALIITVIIGFVFASTLTGPIKSLTIKAREMAQGNLRSKIEVMSKDEIGELTESFNNMAEELNKTLYFVSTEKNKLETVIEHMEDGITAFNKRGDLIKYNKAFIKVLGLKKVYPNFNRLFKFLNIDIKFEEFLEKERTISQLELIGNKFVTINFVTYTDEYGDVDGVIVVFRDITKQAKLEEMRKGFIADVSHEMRTPLSVIKGATETLQVGAINDPEFAARFLENIINEADRMENLVGDLLDLSKLDNKQISMSMTKINMKDIIKKEIDQKMVVAKKKKQKLIYNEIEKDNLDIRGDKSRVLQVISNILSNSIKYSGEGARIEVSVDDNEDYVRVIIKDNGEGISKEDQTRIFERFYRVDKARSRTMKGTGLGLAIVKEIMDRHEGKIALESKLGEGSTFYLSFPKYK